MCNLADDMRVTHAAYCILNLCKIKILKGLWWHPDERLLITILPVKLFSLDITMNRSIRYGCRQEHTISPQILQKTTGGISQMLTRADGKNLGYMYVSLMGIKRVRTVRPLRRSYLLKLSDCQRTSSRLVQKKYHAGKAIALLSSNKRGGNPFTMAFI